MADSTTEIVDTAQPPDELRPYLLVFAGNDARVVALPADGTVEIGRDREAHVHVDDPKVSRRHAALRLHDGRATLRDLGSNNGTFVDGVRIEGELALRPGAVITILGHHLVFHGGAHRRQRVVGAAALREQIADEIERGLVEERTFGVLVLDRPAGALVDELATSLRPIDRIAQDSDHLVVFLPESEPDEVAAAATRLRAGWAVWPRDASDVDSLLAAARAAVRQVRFGDDVVYIADDRMARVYSLLERVAPIDVTILIVGETGTGKRLAAAAVHHFSGRGALTTIACQAAPDDLDAALGAAAGGTLFLDEIGELSPAHQTLLLAALEVGRADARIVATTRRDLRAEVAAGRFREELFYRLSAATVWLPPLRDRRREIPLLAEAFLPAGHRFTPEALRRLTAYPWPGNVRELRGCIEVLAAAAAGPVIDAAAVARHVLGGNAPSPRMFRPIKEEVRELERRRMIEALRAADGNQTYAAALIEMPLRTFVTKLKQYAIDPKDPDRADPA